uniref:Uncharacterized protein n=1 Tax=Oncorhynchus tshawytscha TaxID=74940 RepID=A0AAZ3Q8Q4_ONCTS
MEAPEDVSVREQLFHDRVRETIICVLLFICLYIVSYLVITHYKRNAEFTIDNSEDATVNKIALWLCTFTLSVSVGAVLLLPLSILSNEVLLSFPQSYYMQWLNGSLIHGLWNIVFLFSNLSLVFLLPFAYFFTESEGFAGSKKGVMARLYETAVVLFLLTLLVLGMVWVASAILDDNMARQSLYDLWEYYLPYLYSCISLFGVLLLLLYTNSGFLFLPTEIRKRASPWQRNLGYPLAMLLLLAVTVRRGRLTTHLASSFKMLCLLFDDTAMPRGMEDPLLGAASFSMFGSLGAAVQVILILYLMISSVVGFYSSPLFTRLRPRAQDTTLTQIIGNCVSLLVLSSALPVFSRTLGITRFDLLGDFGRFNWLGNFHIVFLYNILFAGLTSACLINTLTWTVQRELIRAFGLHKLPSTVSRSTIPLRLLLANGLSKIQ